jgi:hypothetical protein
VRAEVWKEPRERTGHARKRPITTDSRRTDPLIALAIGGRKSRITKSLLNDPRNRRGVQGDGRENSEWW